SVRPMIVSVGFMFLFALSRRRPISRIRPGNGGMMSGWGIMEIEPHGRRSKQHVDRNAGRGGTGYPGAAFEVNVLMTVVAVIDLVARVVNVVILHHDFTLHVNRRWRGV